MNTIWNEAAIRREFVRLDAETGLKGVKLPISFGNAKGTLGSYTSANRGALRCSKYYFDDASWKRCCLEEGALSIPAIAVNGQNFIKISMRKRSKNRLFLINIRLAVPSYIPNLERVK